MLPSPPHAIATPLELFAQSFAISLRDRVFKAAYDNTTTLFLCGASLDNAKSGRSQIAAALSQTSLLGKYDIFYPEQIFDELLREDLLELENQLAQCVDVVILVAESVGAYAELGAFANHEQLSKRLLCIIDRKYRRAKSFINAGPIRHLQRTKSGRTLYINWNDIPGEMPRIRKGIRDVKDSSTKDVVVDNVIYSYHFVLPCIFLLEPVHFSTLKLMVGIAAGRTQHAHDATSSALSMLFKQKLIVRVAQTGGRSQKTEMDSPNGPTHVYRLTRAGIDLFQSGGLAQSRRRHNIVNILDELRLMVMKFRRRFEDIIL